ncbi:MAG: hypothetical protein D6769_01705 [Methanobacteriota archaeon]|nr:MAG: hypothetical protein D6769_01705 [Euryarchaeota archaeon]
MKLMVKGVYRVALICKKEKLKDIAKKLIKEEVYEPKKVEKEYGGPYVDSSLIKGIGYENHIREALQKIGRKVNIAFKFDEMESIIIEVVEKIERLKKEGWKGKIDDVEMAKIWASLEYIEYLKLVKKVMDKDEKLDSFVLLEGWSDARGIEVLRGMLGKDIQVFEHIEDSRAPTKVENGNYWSVFDPLIELYPPFKYGTINISPIIGLSFLFIFGMMFANIVDGTIVFLITSVLFTRKKDKMYALGALMGLSSVAFGLVFEGCTLCGIQPFYPVFEEPIKFLVLVMGFAFIHQIIGNILGIANNLAIGERKDAAFRAMSVLIYVIAVGYVLGSEALMVGSGILALLLLLYSGLEKATEMPHILSHFISYARIFAIGISHYTIVSVVGGLLQTFLGNGVVFIGSLLFAHFIVIFIEGIIAFVHTLRLCILEFGTKAVVSGDASFTPIRFNKKHIEW